MDFLYDADGVVNGRIVDPLGVGGLDDSGSGGATTPAPGTSTPGTSAANTGNEIQIQSGGGSMNMYELLLGCVLVLWSAWQVKLRVRSTAASQVAVLLGGSLLLLSLTAHSAPQSGVLLYGGVSQMQNNVATTLEGLGYGSVDADDQTQANGWSLGYRQALDEGWSADWQYMNQGTHELDVSAAIPEGKTDAQVAADSSQGAPRRGQGLNVVMLKHHPVSAAASVQAGAGLFVWSGERQTTVNGEVYTREDSGAAPVLQLGMGYALTKQLQLEAHWQGALLPGPGKVKHWAGVGVAIQF